MTYEDVNSVEYIWAFMYGSPYKFVVKRGVITKEQDVLIKIDTSCLEWSHEKDVFYYIWGFPGPDFNRYCLSDYKITWCFSPEEIPDAKVHEYSK